MTCGAPRNGSGTNLTGLRKTSELSPEACLVEEPSKFHGDGSWSMLVMALVL